MIHCDGSRSIQQGIYNTSQNNYEPRKYQNGPLEIICLQQGYEHGALSTTLSYTSWEGLLVEEKACGKRWKKNLQTVHKYKCILLLITYFLSNWKKLIKNIFAKQSRRKYFIFVFYNTTKLLTLEETMYLFNKKVTYLHCFRNACNFPIS